MTVGSCSGFYPSIYIPHLGGALRIGLFHIELMLGNENGRARPASAGGPARCRSGCGGVANRRYSPLTFGPKAAAEHELLLILAGFTQGVIDCPVLGQRDIFDRRQRSPEDRGVALTDEVDDPRMAGEAPAAVLHGHLLVATASGLAELNQADRQRYVQLAVIDELCHQILRRRAVRLHPALLLCWVAVYENDSYSIAHSIKFVKCKVYMEKDMTNFLT